MKFMIRRTDWLVELGLDALNGFVFSTRQTPTLVQLLTKLSSAESGSPTVLGNGQITMDLPTEMNS